VNYSPQLSTEEKCPNNSTGNTDGTTHHNSTAFQHPNDNKGATMTTQVRHPPTDNHHNSIMSTINCTWTEKKGVVPRIGMVASEPPAAPHQMVASEPPTANQRTAGPSPPTAPPLSTVSSTNTVAA